MERDLVFFKKVAHMVMEADKYEICGADRLEIRGSIDLAVMRQNSFLIGDLSLFSEGLQLTW